MAADLLDLEEKVRDYLADLFPADIPGKLFLAFESFGASLPLEIFQLQAAGPFIPALVIEQLTKLADDVPLVDARDYHRTIRKVAAQYQMLLAGSQFLPETSEAGKQLFEAVKAEAKTLCDNGTRGSFSPEPIAYLPVLGNPENWYDPASTSWRRVTFSISTGAVTAPSSPAPNPTTRPSIKFTKPLLIQDPLQRERMAWKMMVPVTLPAPPPVSPQPPSRVFSRHMLDRPVRMMPMAGVSTRANFTRVALNPAITTPSAATRTMLVDDRFRNRIIRARPELIAALNNTTPTPPPPSESLEITFDVLAVELERRWLHLPFIDLRNWYVPGYYSGDFNAEILPAVPIGMLLVRNLSITAKGAGNKQLAEAVCFGPFELVDKKPAEVREDQGRYYVSVKVEGTQIVAWVGQILPPLPPTSDPTLPPKVVA